MSNRFTTVCSFAFLPTSIGFIVIFHLFFFFFSPRTDILRYTQKTSVDYKALEAAIVSIQEVMAHINEDKRKTEGQVALFDIFNEIENCPVRRGKFFVVVVAFVAYSSIGPTKCHRQSAEYNDNIVLLWYRNFMIGLFEGKSGRKDDKLRVIIIIVEANLNKP